MSDELTKVLNRGAEEVAQRLLGSILVRQIGNRRVVGKIVETESYDQTDAASHSYRGETPRTSVMFGSSGHAYVYFTYGMHYCFNVVTGEKGQGSAVLIRALEPLEGMEVMQQNRGSAGQQASMLQGLCNGPAKLCQALGIDKELNGHDLSKPPLYIELKAPLPKDKIVQTTRIGITRDSHRLWRFYIKGSSFISKT
jgi:DNA-3-methyladenine glycosylase